MIDDKMREAFERRFPVPNGIYWDAGAEQYEVDEALFTRELDSLADIQQARLQGYIAALTQQPESEPVYRCHTCKEFTSPPRPFGFYVECGKCGGLTAATAAVERQQPFAQMSGDQIVSVFERRGMRIELGAQFSVRGQIAQLIEGVRELLPPAPSSQVPESIHIDNERLAIFEAIQAVKNGNPTDDKLIVDNLHKAGFCVSKVSAAPEFFPGLPYVCKGDWLLGTACGMCERCQDMRGEADQ